ncbi:hypothetical protein HDU85_002253 [Gaertneriomyces sp. JEL0708]|nr:hypothetical protein HDU85_002253 [Gaertneriomyces sp. JEL0708]
MAPSTSLLALSRTLSVPLFLLGSLLKLPLLPPLLSSLSTSGMPLVPIALETLSLTITIPFNLRMANPYLTWLETVVILFVDLCVMGVWAKEKKGGRGVVVGGLMYAWLLRKLLDPTIVNDAKMHLLLAMTIPLGQLSGMTQIYQQYRQKHIGTMSPVTLLLGMVCGVGRMVTTWVEVEDAGMRWASVVSAILGVVMAAQMAMYRQGTKTFLARSKDK